ncbi:MAG: monofunctional biosynthetic peptidoglycan transglycosylase [Dysgonamonadaceae bacterium]|jgi:monofunctional biosynthetic peptidoglycan transglycosylase|nr:monofunctional biosynthetic peptidoglycan transglycosylase [Dysgonamonadaceae bacterium]
MIKKIFKFAGRAVLWFFAVTIVWVILLKFVPVYTTPVMMIRAMEQLFDGKKPVIHHRWVSSERISDNLKRAVIASEDQLFYRHSGFDKVQIEKAMKENKKRKRPRGASTISQQTAKNVFLWPKSSWIRKGFEVYFTFLIEIIWGKDRILEVYLNSMETGDGFFGAESVARINFNTTAAKLSAPQSALIAATLPNPRRFSSKNPSAYMKKRQSHILEQMRRIELSEKE